jgi:hypothetical protein
VVPPVEEFKTIFDSEMSYDSCSTDSAEKCTNGASVGAGLAHKINLKVNILLIVLKRIIIFPLLALSFFVMTRQCYLERGSIVQRCLPINNFDFHLEVKYSWVFLCSVAV